MARRAPRSRDGLLAALILAAPAAAPAATSASMDFSATIVAGCEINGTLPVNGANVGRFGTLSFGEYPSVSGATVTASLTSAGSLTLRCSPGVNLTMTADNGLHATDTRNLERASGSERIAYQLFSDAALSQQIVAGEQVAVPLSINGTATLPIHGRLILPRNSPAGIYADTITITLNW